MVVAVLSIAAAVAHAAPGGLRFDGDAVDAPPSAMRFGRTGPGRPGRWVVQDATDAPSGSKVLAQLDTDDTSGRFALAIADAPVAANVRVSVKCKAILRQGRPGVRPRLAIPRRNNYYVARANELEGNVRIYLVKDGKRQQIGSASEAITPAVWHELCVDAAGDRYRVTWNGKQVLDVREATFSRAGKAGVWTKADSVTQFDDLIIDPRDP